MVFAFVVVARRCVIIVLAFGLGESLPTFCCYRRPLRLFGVRVLTHLLLLRRASHELVGVSVVAPRGA